MKLPRVPYRMVKNKSEIVALRGINFGDLLRDGDLRDCTNLSARRYPYLTVRRGRETVDDSETVIALTEWDGKLVRVYRGGANADGEYEVHISYDGAALSDESGSAAVLSDTDKQFAFVGNKLVIFPDKVYVDFSKDEKTPEAAPTVRSMTVSKGWRGSGFTASTVSVYKKISDPADTKLSNYYKAGDVIAVSNIYRVDGNGDSHAVSVNDGVEFTVASVDDAAWTITAEGTPFTEYRTENMTGPESMLYTLSSKFPELDYICEYNNRLCGCSGKTQTIYVSALGEPTQLYLYDGTDTGSFAVAVGSDGAFTGCTRLGSSVLFWKEDKLHKLLGDYASEYALYSYDVDGVLSGSHKSQQVIGEVLYYLGTQGVYAYTGGLPTRISGSFGQRRFKNGVAGRDADSYYLSVEDESGDTHLLVYETRLGLWLREDDLRARDFVRSGRDLYALDGSGSVHKLDSGAEEAGIRWMAQFAPFYETMRGRKTYSKLVLRAEVPKGAYIKVEVRFDGGDWKSCSAIVGKDSDAVPIPIPIRRCDKFELRLSGKGAVTVLGMMREFYLRSDV